MMVSVQTHLRQVERKLRRMLRDSRVRLGGKLGLLFSGGFFLSAAGFRDAPQPLVMGLLCAFPGWKGLVISLGSLAGYPVFWGKEGVQGLFWTVSGLLLACLPGEDARKILLRCALAAFFVSLGGLGFQLFFGEETAFSLYLLRIGLAAAVCAPCRSGSVFLSSSPPFWAARWAACFF